MRFEIENDWWENDWWEEFVVGEYLHPINIRGN
jgi:hypothetical protein